MPDEAWRAIGGLDPFGTPGGGPIVYRGTSSPSPCDGRLKERSVARRFPPRCRIPIRRLTAAGYRHRRWARFSLETGGGFTLSHWVGEALSLTTGLTPSDRAILVSEFQAQRHVSTAGEIRPPRGTEF